jgi:hypothetical protein
MIPLPFTDAGLHLDLPFGFLPPFLRVLAVLLLLVCCVAVVVRLYRLELTRVTSLTARCLLGLRVAAVAAVFLVLATRPVAVRTVSEPVPGRVIVAVDVSDSMRVSDPGRAWTRVELAGRVLTSDGLDLLGRVRAAHAVELVAFGQTLAELPTDSEALAVALAIRSPQMAFTDLKLPLARAAAAAPDSPVLGVVILTDGQHNWGESPLPLARTLGARGVPVYPVNVAAREPPADVAVVAAAPAVPTVPRGSSVPVVARIRITRMPPGPVRVELRYPDDRPPLVQTIPHAGPDRVYEVTFHPKFDRAGMQPLTVLAIPARPDARPENNVRTTSVRVVDDRPRVLILDGEADPLGLASPKLPDDVTLAGIDCVVLADPTPDQIPPRDRERLEKYVADAGGTLVVVAGARFVPIGLSESAPDSDPLRKLLPIRTPRVLAPAETGFRPQLTADGRAAWFLRLGDTADENEAAWAKLPELEWAAVGEAKQGAEVLATLPDGDAALIARHNYGFGRVLYVGFDGSWRWVKTDPEDHHRFRAQVVQWAAADRLSPVKNAAGTIHFGTRQASYPANRDVEFVLRAAEPVPPLGPNAAKDVRMIRLPATPGEPETVVGVIPLVAVDGRPRELVASFPNLPPGRYAVEPVIPEWADHLRGPVGSPRAVFEVRPPESEELNELTADVALLESLASASGGRVFDLSNAGELPEILAARSVTKETEVSRPLGRSWWTLVVVALLLTAEWMIRRASGLA